MKANKPCLPAPNPGFPFTCAPPPQADALRVIDLVNAAFAIEDFLEGTRTDAERLAAMMTKGTVLVAEEDGGRLLATVYYEVRGKRGYLGMLSVDPARQGEGLASVVVREAEDRMRAAGCEAVDITVLSLRPQLLPIYKRFGFVETGTEPFAYGRVFREPMECTLYPDGQGAVAGGWRRAETWLNRLRKNSVSRDAGARNRREAEGNPPHKPRGMKGLYSPRASGKNSLGR